MLLQICCLFNLQCQRRALEEAISLLCFNLCYTSSSPCTENSFLWWAIFWWCLEERERVYLSGVSGIRDFKGLPEFVKSNVLESEHLEKPTSQDNLNVFHSVSPSQHVP